MTTNRTASGLALALFSMLALSCDQTCHSAYTSGSCSGDLKLGGQTLGAGYAQVEFSDSLVVYWPDMSNTVACLSIKGIAADSTGAHALSEYTTTLCSCAAPKTLSDQTCWDPNTNATSAATCTTAQGQLTLQHFEHATKDSIQVWNVAASLHATSGVIGDADITYTSNEIEVGCGSGSGGMF